VRAVDEGASVRVVAKSERAGRHAQEVTLDG
jgi:hypothetical protein